VISQTCPPAGRFSSFGKIGVLMIIPGLSETGHGFGNWGVVKPF